MERSEHDNARYEEHPMTTIKRLLRRLDSYTLDVFNAPQTHDRTHDRTHARRSAR
jgi:hypothetical protein